MVVEQCEPEWRQETAGFGLYQEEALEARITAWECTIIPAVLKAEQEDRIAWRERGERAIGYDAFCVLLKKHGILVLDRIQFYPNYHAVREALSPLNPELTIVIAA